MFQVEASWYSQVNSHSHLVVLSYGPSWWKCHVPEKDVGSALAGRLVPQMLIKQAQSAVLLGVPCACWSPACSTEYWILMIQDDCNSECILLLWAPAVHQCLGAGLPESFSQCLLNVSFRSFPCTWTWVGFGSLFPLPRAPCCFWCLCFFVWWWEASGPSALILFPFQYFYPLPIQSKLRF